MSIETELKLLVAARDIARLRRHPLLKQAVRAPAHKLYTVYYDTPDLELWRAGLTLRLRRRDGRWVQTIKGEGSVVAGLHRRMEIEAEVTGPLPDFTAIRERELARRFRSARLRAQLKPVMITQFTRASHLISPAAEVSIEASVDRGVIKSGDATEPVSELELELRSGEPWRAYQAGLQLLSAAPLLVENRSKAERGIALHTGTPRQPVKAADSPVVEGMSAQEAFKALLQACLAQFIANQHGMLEGRDPEYLHQMRVALRRLRSVFSTFAPLFPEGALSPPVTETRWLARKLGRARDWDVFNTETLPRVVTHYADHAGIAALRRAAASRRLAANRVARCAVKSTRAQGFLLALGGWLAAQTWRSGMAPAQLDALARPVGEFANAVLERALARVVKRGRHFARRTPPQLHRLRIAAKKLRYATEFFGPLYDGKRVRDFHAALGEIQDGLGRLNDAQTVTRLAARASGGLKGAAVSEARGILFGWSIATQELGARRLRGKWKAFRASAPFWK